MYRSLTEAFPGITVISEETSQDCDTIVIEDIKNSVKSIEGYDLTDDIVNVNDVTIWIDPLDATKEFTGKGASLPILYSSTSNKITFQVIYGRHSYF